MASKNSSLSHSKTKSPQAIAPSLLTWFAQHGRHDLPWQHPRSAYRVWVSEIMLQQTQVTTVIPYFERFMQTFKSIRELANAHIDEVLHLWTGLGYYARARNLHKAAQQIRDQYAGEFPQVFDDIIALPGIGRSTAGAILAQAFDKRFAILDGNVKRVLTRLHAIDGWPGNKKIEEQLWQLADQHTPQNHIVDYTQAIMDLGATLCKRNKPLCDDCPLHHQCQACAQSRQAEFPTHKPAKTKPVKATRMLILEDEQNKILLEQRPASGIWGGLWSFPECPEQEDLKTWCLNELQLKIQQATELPALRHSFSHYHLDIQPIRARAMPVGIMDSERFFWYNTRQPDARGLPAPIKTLLDNLQMSELREDA